MASVNKVILIGNLGKNPELRYTPGGQAVANFSIATSEKFTDKSGQKRESTEWHNIVAWGKLGELANQYLKKGRPVYIEGKLTTRSWDDKDGNKKYKTEVVANQMQFLGSAPGGGQAEGDTQAPPTDNADEFGASASVAEPPMPPMPSQTAATQDDLPF
jgi:single-strand DNA-binding protein